MNTSVSVGVALTQDANRLAHALGLSTREARFEAELLLTRALGIPRAHLIAHPELAAQALQHTGYREWLERRLTGEPIAYILGEREFYELSFHVLPAVLIPRPETELLVELALERLGRGIQAQVLDLGTGSGCIAVSIAHLCPEVYVTATDISEAALAVAQINAQRHAPGNVELRLGDCYAPVASEQFDLVVCNPPYVAATDPHLAQGDLRFEPKQALTSGPDGLALLREVVEHAPARLRPGGWLLVEHGHDQAGPVRRLLQIAGFGEVLASRDLAGVPRVAAGRLTLKP